ncbi:MAG: hypothetical protein KTR31_08730 [Myxococcales bacterium]|nr:hypothetical protein [Myxococcales bacterium]
MRAELCWMLPCALALAACEPASDRSGDTTTTTEPPPCTTDADIVAIDAPVLGEQSTEDLLSEYALKSVENPTWFDDADRPLTIEFQWTGTDVVLVTVSGPSPECDADPMLRLDLQVTLSTEDGLIDERLTSQTSLRPGVAISVGGRVDPGREGGTIDTLASIATIYDGELDEAWLDVSAFALVDDASGGWLTAIGRTEAVPGGLVEADIAHW